MQIEDATEHAARHGEAAEKESDAIEAAEAALERGFIVLCIDGDAKTLEAFAESHTYLDYTNGPSTVDLIQVVLSAALGRDVKNEAIALRLRMAKSYANYNVDILAATEGL